MKCVLTLALCFHEISLQVFLVNHFIAMDKSWMKITNRRLREYLDGVQQFLNFASNHAHLDGTILCPCRKCVHRNSWPINVIQAHLVSNGICMCYNPCVFNGKSLSAQTSTEIPNSHAQENLIEYADLRDMLHDMFLIQNMASRPMEEVSVVQQPIEGPTEGPNEDAFRFMKLLEDANQPCYKGCKHFSKLSAIVHLYHMKCLNGWTKKSFTKLLKFLLDFLPSNAKLPKDCYQAKKIIKDLGLAMRRFMLVLKIVFYVGRRMPTLKLVQTVTFQDGKVMSLKVNKALILPPRKEKRKLQRSYGGSP